MQRLDAKNRRTPAPGRWLLSAAFFAAAFVAAVACMPASNANGGTDEQTVLTSPQSRTGRQTAKPAAARDPYAKEVTKRGNTVLVSPEYAAAVKKDNGVLLSKVAVKARLDRAGQIAGYQLVTIDQGSGPSKMGFKPGDVITAVNGIPAREFEANRASLQSATKFEVDFQRKGTARKLSVEIK